eukprot:s3218_g5.t1
MAPASALCDVWMKSKRIRQRFAKGHSFVQFPAVEEGKPENTMSTMALAMNSRTLLGMAKHYRVLSGKKVPIVNLQKADAGVRSLFGMIQALRDEAAAASNDVEEDMEEEEAEEDEEVWADGAAGEEDWDDEQQDEEYNEDDFKPADQLGPEDECTFSSDDVKSDSAPPAAPRKGLRADASDPVRRKLFNDPDEVADTFVELGLECPEDTAGPEASDGVDRALHGADEPGSVMAAPEPQSPLPSNESEPDDGYGAGKVVPHVSLEEQNLLRSTLRSKLRRNRKSRSKRNLLRKNSKGKAKRKSTSSAEGSSKSKKRRASSEVRSGAVKKSMPDDGVDLDEDDAESGDCLTKATVVKGKPKSKAKASPALPKAKAKAKATAKATAKAKATPKAKAKGKAKAKAAPKDVKKPVKSKSKAKSALEEGDRLSPDRKRTGMSKCGFFVLGCSSCRWAPIGCGTCLRPSFNGWRWNRIACGNN